MNTVISLSLLIFFFLRMPLLNTVYSNWPTLFKVKAGSQSSFPVDSQVTMSHPCTMESHVDHGEMHWPCVCLPGIQRPARLSPVTRLSCAGAKASSAADNGVGLCGGLQQTADCPLPLNTPLFCPVNHPSLSPPLLVSFTVANTLVYPFNSDGLLWRGRRRRCVPW